MASEKGEKLRQAALKYRDELGHDEKLRYEGKLKLIDNEDPYEMPTSAWSEDESLLPSVTYPDIVNYLVFSPSPYSLEDLKSYKGLDAYNQFVCGWVREKMSRVVNDNCLTTAKSYWLLPSSVKGVTFRKCSEIDFTSAKNLKKKLDTKITACSGHKAEVTPEKTASKKWTPEPKQDELSHFFSALNLCESKPAILSIVPEFSDSYIPQPVKENFPTVLSELRDDEALCMNYSELLKKCQKIELIVSEEQVKAVESATREQSNSKLWHRFRTGRITASKMKNVCNTDPTFPSQSLIKSICYPESYKFKSAATQCGCQHEK
ncbi:hypothetical protein ACJMK2_037246 [Sinanodonta woodiana]|uniref:Uncharacterized protein n=1 Tax=Sinanodonta woodiana TaxID=1069815 RepID=A0ABD3WL31_SINWO